jgi:hypothetical protein
MPSHQLIFFLPLVPGVRHHAGRLGLLQVQGILPFHLDLWRIRQQHSLPGSSEGFGSKVGKLSRCGLGSCLSRFAATFFQMSSLSPRLA